MERHRRRDKLRDWARQFRPHMKGDPPDPAGHSTATPLSVPSSASVPSGNPVAIAQTTLDPDTLRRASSASVHPSPPSSGSTTRHTNVGPSDSTSLATDHSTSKTQANNSGDASLPPALINTQGASLWTKAAEGLSKEDLELLQNDGTTSVLTEPSRRS